MRSSAARSAALAFAALSAWLPSCALRAPCGALGCPPACPRDASRDASGRCACAPGTVLALGACVGPAVGDAACGPAERMGADGCAPRACAPGEIPDLATGACVRRASLRRVGADCPEATVPAARAGAVACLRTSDTCPHGTVRQGDRCLRAPACPPGSLPEGEACRAFVSAGRGRSGAPGVDVGAWVGQVVGVDGGRGAADLCRDLARRADAFGVAPGETQPVLLRVTLSVPDQDTTRATSAVEVLVGAPPAALVPAPGAAVEVTERVMASLLEPFRGLGGEATAAALRVSVRCDVAAP